jgi:hypothetical protein
VFFPKYQVLFANGAAFEQLIQSQQSILRKAAAAVQETAIANRLGEAEAAEAWCTDGGSIVMASEEQMAAFVEAAQPVFDQIQANPANAELVDAIQELKANVEPSPGAEACGAAATQPPSEAVEQNWSGELPPNGIWTAELTPEDYVRNGVRQSAANEWAGEFWYEFQDGQGGFRGEFLDGLVVCPFTYEAVENFMRITFVDDGNPNYNCGNEVHELQWRLDTEGLRFHVVAIHNGPRVENTAHYEARPWQKVEE